MSDHDSAPASLDGAPALRQPVARTSRSGLWVAIFLIAAIVAPFAIGFTMLAIDRSAIARDEATTIAVQTGEVERVSSGGRTPSRTFYVIYEYTVDDVVYSIRGRSFSVEADAEREARRGLVATVHYERGNPANAYLSDVREAE